MTTLIHSALLGLIEQSGTAVTILVNGVQRAELLGLLDALNAADEASATGSEVA